MGGTEAGEPREFGNFFSSAKDFPLLPGPNLVPGDVKGYPIDLRLKARLPGWPPPWLDAAQGRLVVNVCQWGLGSYERHLSGEGEQWLEWAQLCGEHLLAAQSTEAGPHDGGWIHHEAYHHTFPLPPPWLSAMAQGQGASLLVRLHGATGEERYADAARRALMPLRVPSELGGVEAQLGGGPFPEEYPTRPPSFVLNGGVFALFGLYDVWKGLDDPEAGGLFERSADTLARSVHRWDTGWWSRYDLFPHPVPNIASSAYHLLHISQLQALNELYPRPELERTLGRFRRYQRSQVSRRLSFAGKALFRVLVPRNPKLARRLPWSPFFRTPG